MTASLAILDICKNLIEGIENKKFSCCIFLDFAKAFDTVTYKILISKLEHYGIRRTSLELFRSYLNNRTQGVFVDYAEATQGSRCWVSADATTVGSVGQGFAIASSWETGEK